MIVKLITFAIMALGAFMLSGYIAIHLPSVKETAFIVGTLVFTWGTLILFSLLGFAGYVSTKV